jgi:hypothetical protein
MHNANWTGAGEAGPATNKRVLACGNHDMRPHPGSSPGVVFQSPGIIFIGATVKNCLSQAACLIGCV